MRHVIVILAFALTLLGLSACGDDNRSTGGTDTSIDVARSVRWFDFSSTVSAWNRDDALSMTYVDNSDGSGLDTITDQSDVLFYFTGLSRVADIDTNTYLPGAVADHLTSYGGALPGGGQMSILEWIQAGVTASFGTAVEPCNYTSKFPQTSVFVPHYFRGETVVEAYWKSVRWPGEGNFAGEPLARPYGPPLVTWDTGTLAIEMTVMPAFTYSLESASTVTGPWSTVVEDFESPTYRFETLVLAEAWEPYYRLTWEPI